MPLTRYIRSFASLAAGATQGLQTPHVAVRYAVLEQKYETIRKKWFDLVNLFDLNQAVNNIIKDKLYLLEDSPEIEGYLNDRYLVMAFDEVDKNLEVLDNTSKFIYLTRIRDDIRIYYQDLIFILPNDKIEEVLIDEFNNFEWKKRFIEKNDISNHEKLNKEFFIKYYNSIYFLHYNVEIELNELIARVPLKTIKSEEINFETSYNKQLVSKKEIINNYYITGGKNVIANNVESLTFTSDESVQHAIDPYEIVITICNHFKSLIENNGLFKLIYENDKVNVKHESVPQKLFFAISQIYCIANNIDVSPETNSGAGSVDFKFSIGFNQKVNVELKYSKNPKLVDGFKKQLAAYNKAEQTDRSIYLVINVDDNTKLNELLYLYEQCKEKNETPYLIIIDSKYKDSASKLKE